MRKFIFLAVFAFVGLLAFAQERIAVFPFEDRNNVFTRDELDMLYRDFTSEFKNKTDDSKFTVIDRQEVEKLINMEMKFQLSDYSSKEKTAEMNKVLNARQILHILIIKVDNTIRISVARRTFPDLEVLRGGTTISVANKNQFFDKIPELVQKMVSEIGGGTPPPPTYKIGDTGPAGGIVFFDRGFTRDGWRYLEAAPAGAEFTAEWGAYLKDVSNTMTAVGFGKQNTKIIVDRLRALGETNKAAQVCAALDINGYKDWFLPSKDELNLMYTNLKQKGLGGFKTVEDRTDRTSWTNAYWSSSQRHASSAWGQGFIFDYQNEIGRDNTCSVRAVRAF
jgi:hypothetical protein